MKRSFFTNAVVLTITTQLLRITGLFFIAFLSGRIGAEGVGLYQLISSVYFLASTFAISGVGVAVSRLTAESIGKSGGRAISGVVGRAAVFSLFIGVIAGAALFLLSGFIGETLLGDARSVLSLKMLSPGLPFMAVTTCLRGYFLGRKKAAIPASQMIFEQAVQLTVLFSIINTFLPMGLEYACFAIAVSSVISEALSLCYGVLLYVIEKRRSKLALMYDANINSRILSISVPVALSSYLRSGLRTAENMLIPSGLRRFGLGEREALSQFGLLGMVMPVLLFPSSFLTAISSLLLPEIAEASSAGNVLKVRFIFSRVFKTTSVLSLLFSGIFAAFAPDFGSLIYNSGEAARLLMLLAPLVPLIYLDFIVDSMLNGLNQQIKTLKINTLDYAIRICLILILIPRFGFFAYVAIFYSSTMLNAFLSIRQLLIVSGSKIDYAGWIISPALSAAAACMAVKLLFKLPGVSYPHAGVLVLKIALTITIYVMLLYITRCISGPDMAWIKNAFRRSRRSAFQADGETRYRNIQR